MTLLSSSDLSECDTSANSCDEDNNDDTLYDTDEEVDATVNPVVFTPVPNQKFSSNKPIKIEINQANQAKSTTLPLCMALNGRSLYNKSNNFKNLLEQICPDISIVSETWERQKQGQSELIKSSQFKVISHKRKQINNRQPGGGCAIFYNDRSFRVSNLDINPPEGVEACWALLSPLIVTPHHRVKKLVVSSIYVSPKSAFKQATVEHIIETIHYLRSVYDNDVSFLIGGDLNKLDIEPILDSYGALKQAISVPTRKSATLTNIITDLSNLYYPPTTLPALQVDEGKKGENSDHQVIIFAPLSNTTYVKKRCKKVIVTRPIPDSGIQEFGKETT